MEVYVYILITIHILLFGQAIGAQDKKAFSVAFWSSIVMAPIFGRILGWW